MKQLTLIGFMAVLGFGLNAQQIKPKVATKTNKVENVIPKVSIKDVRALIDTSTTPLIINFWATWCGPCVREIPYFDSLVALQDQPVRLVLVSLDFPDAYPKQLAAFVKKQGYKSEVLFLNEKDADYFCPAIDKKWGGAIPASVFVNNKKKYYEFFGTQLTRQRLAIELKKLVE